MDIGKFEKRMYDALGELRHLLVQSGYYDNQTLENIDCDSDDPDDVQRWNELTNTSKLLLKAVDDLNYLHRPTAGTEKRGDPGAAAPGQGRGSGCPPTAD